VMVVATDIGANIEALNKRIANACQRAGRSPDEVTIVAVTKMVDPSAIVTAFGFTTNSLFTGINISSSTTLFCICFKNCGSMGKSVGHPAISRASWNVNLSNLSISGKVDFIALVTISILFVSKSLFSEKILKTKKPGAAALLPSGELDTLAICS